MPKDDERKEMTQEELDAREEKFRTFFTTSVAQVPEEMTRRDDENEEQPKSCLLYTSPSPRDYAASRMRRPVSYTHLTLPTKRIV